MIILKNCVIPSIRPSTCVPPVVGDILANEVTIPFLKIVKQAGFEYVKDGKISSSTMEKLNIPMIPEDIYAKMANESK